MRPLIRNHFVPLGVVSFLLVTLQILGGIRFLAFEESTQEVLDSSKERTNYIYSFEEDSILENDFSRGLAQRKIVFLGSSELTGNISSLPHKFFTSKIGIPCLSVGHAGNQTLSMASQLLANRKYLKDSRLVILLSPGWFEAKSIFGTSIASFLEYNSERWIGRINLDPGIPFAFKVRLGEYVSTQYSNIINPSNSIKTFYFLYESQKTLIHKIINYPFYQLNRVRIKKQTFDLDTGLVYYAGFNDEFKEEEKWGKLFSAFDRSHKEKSNNNDWGIDSLLFEKYYKRGKGHIWTVKDNVNQELKDLEFLCEVLKYYNASPLFVMMPLNPFYYEGMDRLNLSIDKAIGFLENNQFSYLNLFTSDTAIYNKSLLKDVMHFDDYGWCKVNEFVFKNYVDNEENKSW